LVTISLTIDGIVDHCADRMKKTFKKQGLNFRNCYTFAQIVFFSCIYFVLRNQTSFRIHETMPSLKKHIVKTTTST